MRKVSYIIMMSLFIFLSGRSFAQQETPAQQAPAAVPAQIDPKAFEAAKELVHSLNMNDLLQGIFGVMSKTMIPLIARDNPQQVQQVQKLAIDSVQKTFMAHMEELENNKAIIYAQIYSYDELQQLKAFYQSPVGQKTLKTMPEMMQKTVVLDQGIILQAAQEAKKNLRDALKQNGLKVPKEMEL